MSSTSKLICVCSFCSNKIGFTKEQRKKKAKCSKCKSVIRLFENQKVDLRKILASTWFVKVPKKLFLSETLGPMSEIDFVKMQRQGTLNPRCEVKSSRATRVTNGFYSIRESCRSWLKKRN